MGFGWSMSLTASPGGQPESRRPITHLREKHRKLDEVDSYGRLAASIVVKAFVATRVFFQIEPILGSD
jgi:hypothetical protein